MYTPFNRYYTLPPTAKQPVYPIKLPRKGTSQITLHCRLPFSSVPSNACSIHLRYWFPFSGNHHSISNELLFRLHTLPPLHSDTQSRIIVMLMKCTLTDYLPILYTTALHSSQRTLYRFEWKGVPRQNPQHQIIQRKIQRD